jgi:hypothetical protein
MEQDQASRAIWMTGAVCSVLTAVSMAGSAFAGGAPFLLQVTVGGYFILLALSWLCLAHLLFYRCRLRLLPAVAALTAITVLLNMLLLRTGGPTVLVYLWFLGVMLLGLLLLLSPHGLPAVLRVYGLVPLLSQVLYWAAEMGSAWTRYLPVLRASIEIAGALLLAGVLLWSWRQEVKHVASLA